MSQSGVIQTVIQTIPDIRNTEQIYYHSHRDRGSWVNQILLLALRSKNCLSLIVILDLCNSVVSQGSTRYFVILSSRYYLLLLIYKYLDVYQFILFINILCLCKYIRTELDVRTLSFPLNYPYILYITRIRQTISNIWHAHSPTQPVFHSSSVHWLRDICV